MVSSYLKLGISPETVSPVPVDFGEWLPDLPEKDNPGAIEALNVIPSEACYVPFPQITAAAGSLPNEVRGAAFVYAKTGSTQLYAADSSGVYIRIGGTFSQRYATAYPLYADYLWQFVQFGNNIVALHPQIIPQAGEVGGASLFSPLGGSPPIASCGARIGDFLVLGNLDGEADPDGPRQPQRIRWSAFNNIDAPWVSDPATQADFNDMPSEGGGVIGITGREFGTVFQERCISRMSYVGLPSVFDIETVEEERGALCTGGIVDLGSLVYFIASDGFFVWNGTNATPIGDNKVNGWFFRNLNYGSRARIVGAYDSVNKCVMWAFPSGGSALNHVIIYSIKENRFSHAQVTVDFLVSGATLDASIDDFTLDLDVDYPVSFDDGVFSGGKPTLAAFTTATHTYGLFTGAPMAATIDTGEFSGPTGQRVFVNSARPLVDVNAPVVSLQVAQRDQLMGEAIVFTTAVVQEITGECPVLADARYMRFRTLIPAGASWRHARGVEIWRKATGRR